MFTRHWRSVLVLSGLGLFGCGPESTKPAGTTADPVEVCEDLAQVCRYDGSKLGVCTKQANGQLTCVSQH